MKVQWSNLISDAHGAIEPNRYVREIPGQTEWAAVCSKPELSKKEKKKRAAHPTAKLFKQSVAICRAILNTPERRAAWQTKYEKAKKKAEKHGQKIQGRLNDYLMHEVMALLKSGATID